MNMTPSRSGLKGKAAVVITAALFLNVQEVIASKKICFEKQASGVIKACVLLGLTSRHDASHACGHAGCRQDAQLPRHRPASLWNEALHHLDIPLLGDWFPRTLDAGGRTLFRFLGLPLALETEPPFPLPAVQPPPEPMSGAPPPLPPDDRSPLLRS